MVAVLGLFTYLNPKLQTLKHKPRGQKYLDVQFNCELISDYPESPISLE